MPSLLSPPLQPGAPNAVPAPAPPALTQPPNDPLPSQPPPGHALARWTLPQAVGIFAVSLSGHSTLPALRAGMAAPSRFPALLTAAFCVMALLYGTVGAMGYWYYGSTTSALITTDISRAGPWTDTAMDKLLACLLLVNCSTKYPALVLVLQASVVCVRAGGCLIVPRGDGKCGTGFDPGAATLPLVLHACASSESSTKGGASPQIMMRWDELPGGCIRSRQEAPAPRLLVWERVLADVSTNTLPTTSSTG